MLALYVLVYLLTALLIAATLAPLINVGEWYVRLWDFPRVQLSVIAGLTGLSLIALDWISGVFPPWDIAIIAVLGGIILWQCAHVVQFMPIWPVDLSAVSPDDDRPLRLAVVNVRKDNPEMDQARDAIAALDCDILLLIEINEQWDEVLAPIKDQYAYRTDHIRDEGLGICLWCRLEPEAVEVKHLVSERRASIHATFRTENGGSFRYIGLHPDPPGLSDSSSEERHDSRVRDAELLLIAKQIAKEKEEAHWIVAGDLNDVAWSHTTRMFKRISGLKDPRIGRGLYNTFHAEYWWMRYPLDHLFVSSAMRLASLGRRRIPGSDHFAIVSELVRCGKQSEPQPQDDDHEEAEGVIEEGFEDAEDKNVKAE